MLNDAPFMEEVRHRASLFKGGLQAGKALAWYRDGDNGARLLQWQYRAQLTTAGPCTDGEVRAFWQALSVDVAMKGFIRSLGPGGVLLCRRGERGDRYSVPVFYFVVSDFISDYIRQDMTGNISPGGQAYCF